MNDLSKSKRILLNAGPFPALAFFKIWAASAPTLNSLTIVAVLMLLFCVIVLWFARRWDEPSYFDWTVAGYFTVLSILLAGWPESAGAFLSSYSVTGIYSCLFAAAFFPPLFGMDPFTYHYAKKTTPQTFWENPVFIRINQIMTHVWSGVFALCLILSLYPSVWTRAIIPIAFIVGFGLPFNLRFPDYYLRRTGLPGLRELRRMVDGMGPLPVETRGDVLHEPVGNGSAKPATADALPLETQTPLYVQSKEGNMKVLALNSSPRTGGESKTELMLDHLVRGMREGGADVEVIELRKKSIKHCIGCFTCWTKTPGECIHKDDMSLELFRKWMEADLVVYATPLYHFTVNARMKAFIERTLPVLQPFFHQNEGQTFHPWRKKPPKCVFLSVAGFPEMAVFDQLSSWVKFIYGSRGSLVAEIYRPGAEMLGQPQFKGKAGEILEATAKAGKELAESMTISSETMARVTHDILEDKEVFYRMGNLMWKTCIAEGITPREFTEKGLIPRPDSLETFMFVMPMGFNPGAAGDLRAVLQFHFTGEVNGSCYFEIQQGKIKAVAGTAARPDLTIDSPFEVWMDIMTRKADGQKAFMERKYSVSGDLSLLIRMNQIFGK